MAINPHLFDVVEVTVTGQPGATKKQLYWLAMSVAFRLATRNEAIVGGVVVPIAPFGVLEVLPGFRFTPPGQIEIQYDAASNWVKCILMYEQNMMAGSLGPRAIDKFYLTNTVYNGPTCDVVGAEFEFTGGGAGSAIPPSASSPESPRLPFFGDTILASCPAAKIPLPGAPQIVKAVAPVVPSLNPKPPGDNRSRGAIVTPSPSPGAPGNGGAVPMGTAIGDAECCNRSLALIPIVFAALSDPGEFDKAIFVGPLGGTTGG